jgi:hypothetical protein
VAKIKKYRVIFFNDVSGYNIRTSKPRERFTEEELLEVFSHDYFHYIKACNLDETGPYILKQRYDELIENRNKLKYKKALEKIIK